MARITGTAVLLSLLVCLILVTDAAHAPTKLNVRRSKNAYATMMYMGTPRDYEFYIAIRVMMQSLVRLKAEADLVVIASKSVPDRWVRTLNKEGVRVVSVEDIENPYINQPGFNDRFIFTLNKIYAWTLTDYERVVMLDADNMFLQNVDELFQCGQFCACFINPCYFHTGLFVLEPSNKTFTGLLQEIQDQKSNSDGADQGLLIAHFNDLLERPLFRPPGNGSKLDGLYRLPLGYQMDASYFYLRLKWNVPCGPNSVVTFPSIPLMKPWYWWAWPVLPLGLSWHEQRRNSIGYATEIPFMVIQSLFYMITMTISLIIRRRFHQTAEKVPAKMCWGRCPCPDLSQWLYRMMLKAMPVIAMVGSFAVSFMVVPTTVHPVMGWSIFLLGSFSFLVVAVNIFQVGMIAMMTTWMGIIGVLIVMALPIYSNGIWRCLAIGAYAFLAAPFLWWSLKELVSCSRELVSREPLILTWSSNGKQEPQQSELMKMC